MPFDFAPDHAHSMLFHDDPIESDFHDFAHWNPDCGLGMDVYNTSDCHGHGHTHFPEVGALADRIISQSPKPIKQSFVFNDWAHVAPLNLSSAAGSSLSSFDGNACCDPYHASFFSPPLSSLYSSSPEMHNIDSIAQSIENDVTDVQFSQLGMPVFHPGSAFLTPSDLSCVSDNANGSYFDYDLSVPSLCQDDRQASLSSDFDLSLEYATSLRQRGRPRKHGRSISSVPNAKVMKRPTSTNMRRLSAPIRAHSLSVDGSPARQLRDTPTNSNFPCPFTPYGCTSSFGSKNEWKRHVTTQHVRLELWRCDQCGDRDTRPNEFNRKDLFIQHLRRMHFKNADNKNTAEGRTSRARSSSLVEEMDPALVAAEQRCHVKLRQPPEHSRCLFCPVKFEGPGSWDERMEHVGRHLEQLKKQGRDAPPLGEWNHDEAFHNWLDGEGLIAMVNGEWLMAEGRRYSR